MSTREHAGRGRRGYVQKFYMNSLSGVRTQTTQTIKRGGGVCQMFTFVYEDGTGVKSASMQRKFNVYTVHIFGDFLEYFHTIPIFLINECVLEMST